MLILINIFSIALAKVGLEEAYTRHLRYSILGALLRGSPLVAIGSICAIRIPILRYSSLSLIIPYLNSDLVVKSNNFYRLITIRL